MNKTMINVLLFFTLVMGTMAILMINVWADTSTIEVYEIPDDYLSRNYQIEFNRNTSSDSSSLRSYTADYYDFDIYYPEGYDVVMAYYTYCPYGWYNFYPYIYIYTSDTYYYKIIDNMYLDENGVGKLLIGENNDIEIYVKDNGCTARTVSKSLKKDDYANNVSKLEPIKLITICGHSLFYDSETRYKLKTSECFIYSSSRAYRLNENGSYYVLPPIENLTSKYTENFYSQYSNTNKKDISQQIFNDVAKIRKSRSSESFPAPVIKAARLNSDLDLIQITYQYNSDFVPSNVDMYKNVFIKTQGTSEWQTLANLYNNKKLVSVGLNNQYKTILGGFNLDDLYASLGYDETEETSEKPVIEAVIWGVRYEYSTNSGIRNSQYVFSRYVFEDNIISDTDVSIDDLGNLTDIKPGSSGSDVTVKPGGSANNPTISATDEADYSDVGSFFKSLNFDFSSIGKALSRSFSLVTGFASMIGTIFQNFFGEAVGIIALLAIGICIVLRVLGR